MSPNSTRYSIYKRKTRFSKTNKLLMRVFIHSVTSHPLFIVHIYTFGCHHRPLRLLPRDLMLTDTVQLLSALGKFYSGTPFVRVDRSLLKRKTHDYKYYYYTHTQLYFCLSAGHVTLLIRHRCGEQGKRRACEQVANKYVRAHPDNVK